MNFKNMDSYLAGSTKQEQQQILQRQTRQHHKHVVATVAAVSHSRRRFCRWRHVAVMHACGRPFTVCVVHRMGRVVSMRIIWIAWTGLERHGNHEVGHDDHHRNTKYQRKEEWVTPSTGQFTDHHFKINYQRLIIQNNEEETGKKGL